MAPEPELPPDHEVLTQRVSDFRNQMINQRVLRLDVRPCHTLEGQRQRYAVIDTMNPDGSSPYFSYWINRHPPDDDTLKLCLALWLLVNEDKNHVLLFNQADALTKFVVWLTKMYAGQLDLRPRLQVQLEIYGDEGAHPLSMLPPGKLLSEEDLAPHCGAGCIISKWMESLGSIDLDAILTIYLHFQRPYMNYIMIRWATKPLREKQLSGRVQLLLDEDTYRELIPEYEFHCRMMAVVILEPAGTYTFSAADGFTPPTMEGIRRLGRAGAHYPGRFTTSTEVGNVNDDAESEMQPRCLKFTMPV
ncbi:hypothetical protein QBC42DRAFT_260199 [Cladorrhinum samala]|uniref:Uncharacterized protein n=1 Tax=Cladorrhinum samala TaxID=585594 RepID=A0AAV9I0L7_9PEZI|nr:hypothetical protein QBC42DRAFT_260199 [Cladorrhinum samala]